MDWGLVPTRGGFSGTGSFPEHFASNWVTVSLPAYAATKFLLCMDLKEKVIKEEKKLPPVKYEMVTRTLFEVCQALLRLKPHSRVRPWRTWRETHRDSTQHRNACSNNNTLSIARLSCSRKTSDSWPRRVQRPSRCSKCPCPSSTRNTQHGQWFEA